MNKIIFLDIDGVLSTKEAEIGTNNIVPILNEFTETEDVTLFDRESYFSQDAINNLNSIIDHTRANIVISSAWRKYDSIGLLRKLFNHLGIKGQIVGITPTIGGEIEDVRGMEIEWFIRENGITDYVILDDKEFPLDDPMKFIKTDPTWGLTDIDSKDAIKILNNGTLESKEKSILKSLLESEDMEAWFEERTNRHIDLVKKYAKMVVEKFPQYWQLEDIVVIHDQSKFQEPERTPYIHLTWKKKNPDYQVPADIDITTATDCHVRNNPHHPEFWSGQTNTINPNDRDAAPDKMIDGTKMPMVRIAEMTADWMAVSEEMGSHPKDWADKQINVRWKFTPEQVKRIYDIIERVWPK